MLTVGRARLVHAAVALCASSALAGCGDRGCTLEDRTAVVVELAGPGAMEVTRVTATESAETDCEQDVEGLVFLCSEQSGGRYRIAAYRGEQEVATSTVRVAADECHVTQSKRVVLVIL